MLPAAEAAAPEELRDVGDFCQELAAFALGTAKRCHEGAAAAGVAATATVKVEVKEEEDALRDR